MSASAGRVLIIPKGDYSASVTYGNLDMVYYGGKTYVCKKTSLNNLPTNTEYWQLMVEGVAGSYYGTCSTAAATAEKAVTVSADQHFALFKGATITVKFTNTNTATNPTINVNGTGAASVVYGSGVITTGTLSYAGTANYSMTYVYDGTHWCWVSSGADANTTYSPQKLGIGYGTCSTAAATAEKAVTLSGYELITNGTIAVKFTNAVPASATLKVNSKTAKAIYYRGSAITANKIKAGDTAIFYYNGSQYHLICVDRPLDATDVTYSSGVTVKAKIDTKADKTDIATVESGTTASRAYSVGELVYVSGTLYRVKTAITSGATFTVGTNIEVTNVSNKLKDSIKMVYDQYFTLTGTGAIYIDIDQNYPMAGYKLIGLNIASNTLGYVAQARIRNDSKITGFVQKANEGVIATSETVQVGVTLTYMKI